jgi:CheY-like chemotaxis protein/HPt (histidine-containing phosphotransfer) domain-containing protein
MTSPESGLQLPRVLLIDDDPILLNVLAMMLEMDGFSVACAEDGRQAMEMIGASAPELILMDTQLPGLSGLELVEAIRGACGVRLIAISGSEIEPELRAATDGFLLKPFGVDALLALLAEDATRTEGGGTGDSTAGAAVRNGAEPVAEVVPVVKVEPEAATGDLIDPAVLGNLRGMMPAPAVREIYVAVAADLKTRLAALDAAMQARDGREVARIAHTIKGGCAMVGMKSAKNAAFRLESSDNWAAWPQELIDLQGAQSSLEAMLILDFPCNVQ